VSGFGRQGSGCRSLVLCQDPSESPVLGRCDKNALADHLDEATGELDSLSDRLGGVITERDRLAASQRSLVASVEGRESVVKLREDAVNRLSVLAPIRTGSSIPTRALKS